ncbi:MAG: preprotein translocase subunit SecY [Candidatus Paceibacterota bacterium]
MIWNKLRIIFKDSDLRKKILFVVFILVLFRVGSNIPIPGIDQSRLASFLSGNQFFGLLNIFSGGGLSNLSIVMLGVAPYITGTIIMQLLTMIFPKLKEMYHEEGEAGKQKFNQYSRMLTIPLAFLQGFGLLALLGREGIIVNLGLFDKLVNIIIVITGSVILMWLGELISEKGVGNGVSLLIFAGIVASLPGTIQQIAFTFDYSQIPLYLGFVIASVFVVAGVIIITEAERPIPVSYAKQVRGMKMYGGVSTHLPLRVNQAGVIPIIFAISILLFPQMIANVLAGFGGGTMKMIANFLAAFMNNLWLYGISYFILVFAFTYFYTAVTFDPEAISTNLQKSGAFVPGIRPGRPTAEYIGKVLNRITLVGAIFLGLIAVLPIGMKALTGMQALAMGGTALLIVVSVVLETIKQVESQVVMREYE